MVESIQHTVKDVILPDLAHLSNDEVAVNLGRYLIESEMRNDYTEPVLDGDPFRITVPPDGYSIASREVLAQYLTDEKWKEGVEQAAKEKVTEGKLGAVTKLVRGLLGEKSTLSLGKECVSSLFQVSKFSALTGVSAHVPSDSPRHPHNPPPKSGLSSNISPPRFRNYSTNLSSPSPPVPKLLP